MGYEDLGLTSASDGGGANGGARAGATAVDIRRGCAPIWWCMRSRWFELRAKRPSS